MSRHEKAAPRRTRLSGSGRARALLSLGMVLGLGAVGTLAAWSDTATATTGVFTTADGTVDIWLDDQTAVLDFSRLSKANMLPGNTVAAMVSVKNKGTRNFTYKGFATSTGPNALAQYLKVDVWDGGTAPGGATCQGGANNRQVTLAPGTNVPLFASPHTLAAGTGSEDLCLQVTFAANAPFAAQRQLVNAAFVFEATGI